MPVALSHLTLGSEPVVVKETGRLPNGKRFGTGSVSGLDYFADKIFNLLYAAIDVEYPEYETPLDEHESNGVQQELQARKYALHCWLFLVSR